MKIFSKIKDIPASSLLIPMLLTAMINTFAPGFKTIGEPITSLFSGSGVMTLLAMNLFIAGTKLKKEDLSIGMKKSGIVLSIRVVVCIIVSFLYLRLFGSDGIMGVSIVAFVIAMASTNPGIYLSLVESYGDDTDEVVFPVVTFLAQPVIPLTVLSLSGGDAIDIMSIISLLLPFVVGCILGNNSESIRNTFSKATGVVLPFWGICVGSNINLLKAFYSLGSGLVLMVLFLLLCLIPSVLIDKKINKSSGFVLASTCTVSAMCIIVPEIAATITPEYSKYIELAQNQLVTCFLITSLLIPIISKKLVSIK